MNNWSSILTVDCTTYMAYSISIFSEDRNFSPPPDLSLSHQTFYAVSGYQGGKQWEWEADHAVVLGGILKVTVAIYAYCLTYFQSFVFN